MAIDLPGHGHSDGGRHGARNLADNADDLAVVIRALAPEAKAVVGMSLGGMTSLALAHRHPDLVRRLILVDVTPGVTAEKAKAITDFVNGPESFPDFDAILARTVEHNPTRSEASLRRGILHNAEQREDGTWVWRHARHRAEEPADQPAENRFFDLWDAVSGVGVPLMLVRGMRKGSVVDDKDEAELKRRNPDRPRRARAGGGPQHPGRSARRAGPPDRRLRRSLSRASPNPKINPMAPDAPSGHEVARLSFRPDTTSGSNQGRLEPLGLGRVRDGVLYVPDSAGRDAPTLVFLHGATGSGQRHLRSVLGAADRYGVILVAPDSRTEGTWDLLVDRRFGPDVAFVDQVLGALVDRVDADLARLAVGGVSDGASYALSLGLANGDVFSTVVAFSPGFLVVPEPVGRPRVFVSHGTEDQILPIEACSGAFVPQLRAAGYTVQFEVFDGGHTVPPAVADKAFRWWTEGDPAETALS